MTRVLIVLSAADTWTRTDGSLYKTGIWAEEFVAMDEIFLQAGFEVDLASPGGVPATIDHRSVDPAVVGKETARRMTAYLTNNAERMAKPLVLSDVDMSRYQAVAVPGGHGPAEDLYKDADMGRLLMQAHRDEKVIAAVCHGPAAFLAARDDNGRWPFEGRRMTSLTDEEEIEFGTAANAPWLLADTLRKSGAQFEQGPNWGDFVVVDGNIITGQNPASTATMAQSVVAALN
jgi:putative intracellular protease/amidase